MIGFSYVFAYLFNLYLSILHKYKIAFFLMWIILFHLDGD